MGELKISDHKPVSAVFKSGMKVVDNVKYRKIYEDVMKELDKMENEFLPQVAVDTTEITFDKVRFVEAQTQSLAVANTGQVPVQFEFIKKLNDKAICKPWLTVEPTSGFVMPGKLYFFYLFCDFRNVFAFNIKYHLHSGFLKLMLKNFN